MVLNPKQHLDQQCHRENPNEQHFSETEVAHGPGIIGNVRILSEQLASFAKNIHSGNEHEHQQDAEESTQYRRCIFQLANCRGETELH